MWSALNAKYKSFAAATVILYALLSVSYSFYMHSYGKYTTKTAKLQPVSKHYNKTISKYLLSNLAQYNRRIMKLPPAAVELLKKRENTKQKVPSKFKSKLFKFTMLTNYDLHKDSLSSEDFNLLLMVTDKDNNTVLGCNFDAIQIFHNDTPQLKALCTVEDLHNGRYKVLCKNHGNTQCFKLTIFAQYCHYEAFRQSPSILMWNHKVLQRNFCFPEVSSRVSSVPEEYSPSWTLDSHGHCNSLLLHNHVEHVLPDNDTCECIIKQFDNVYIIGTSHIRMVAAFLMHKCYNKDFSNIPTKHGDLEVLNIHYYSWTFFVQLRDHIQKSLDTWLCTSKSLTIWIEIGSHDLANSGYENTMEIGLEHFNQTLTFIQKHVQNSSARVDLRVLASPPMPVGWYLNNFAIGAFNAKLQMICLEHKVSYVDAFSIEIPC